MFLRLLLALWLLSPLQAWEGGFPGSGGGDSFGGPGVSTDNAVVRWDGVTGDTLQNSGVIVDDSNNVTGMVDLTVADQVIADDGQFDTITNEAGTGAPLLLFGASSSGNIDMNTNDLIEVRDVGSSSDGIRDIYFDNSGRIFLDPTKAQGMFTVLTSTSRLQLGTTATSFIDTDSDFIAAGSIQGNTFVRPDTDGGAILGDNTLRFLSVYLFPRSAPLTTVSTNATSFWVTDSAGPYGSATGYGCQRGGCESNGLYYWTVSNSTWRRADGDMIPYTSTTATDTVYVDRVFLADTTLNAQALTLTGCTAALNGRRATVNFYTKGGANTVTITPSSGTINKAANYALTNEGDSVDLVCYGAGTNWFVH